MGYFSWCCKGCGEEIREGEKARLNGCKGVYDGYGRCGGYENDGGRCAAWHEQCYQKATSDQKLDEKASKNAKNQGMGPVHLEFHEHYDNNVPVQFLALVNCNNASTDLSKYQRMSYWLTPAGPKDQEAWDKKAFEEEKDGLEPSPMDEAVPFTTLAAAKQALIKMVEDLGLTQYQAFVFGRQEPKKQKKTLQWEEFRRPVMGTVYEESRHEKCEFKKEGDDYKVIRTGVFETRIWETRSY